MNTLRPGSIYTGFQAKGGEAERVDRLKTLVPMQRGGAPEASYTTGSIVDVAGDR